MARKKTERDEELSGRPAIKKKLLEMFNDVESAFLTQGARVDDIIDYWEIYNTRLGPKQYYNGNSQIFVPIVHAAIDARKTRFVNQLFPQTGRYVEAITNNPGEIPHAEMALLEHYVRVAKLRTQVLPSLSIAGDIEGQYNVYVSWQTRTRHTVYREPKPVEVDGIAVPEAGEVDDLIEEEVFDDHPHVEVLSDSDILIQPTTCDSVEEALACGGKVTIIRRWTKDDVKAMAAAGDFVKDVADQLAGEMSKISIREKENQANRNADAAGIKEKGKFVQGYETWMMLKVDGDSRLCRAYYAGEGKILGCKLNPYWCDLIPLISVPVKKVPGVAKGMSMVHPVAELQYLANDITNEGADSAALSTLPIIMTDPLKNPRIGTMVVTMGAVWETSPNDTKFAEFPKLWQDAGQIAGWCEQKIFQILGVNPSMIPQSTGGKNKRNQAELATEQQVDVLTTADAVTVLEEGVMTPILQRFAAYDAQFRNADITVKAFGMMGKRANMEQVKPLQMGRKYEFLWLGVQAARNAAQMQQQIAGLNVIKGLPPNLIPGRKLDLTMPVEMMVENLFGPRIAPHVFKDLKDELSIPPDQENEMLSQGFVVPISPMDDDAKHLQAHLPLAANLLDNTGAGINLRVHIQQHMQSMQTKAQAQAQAQQPKGLPGGPGGAGPGVAGAPAPGGMPQGPHAAKQPPGAIPQDRMPAAGVVQMPRRT